MEVESHDFGYLIYLINSEKLILFIYLIIYLRYIAKVFSKEGDRV